MKRFHSLLILTAFLSTVQLKAQNTQVFIILGSNLTEAKLTESGKSQIGFRMGINTGAGVSLRLYKSLEMTTEFLFSRNGLYAEFAELPAVELDKIILSYLEVPVLFTYSSTNKNNEKTMFYNHRLSGGIAFARLLNYKIISVEDEDVSNEVLLEYENAFLLNISATSFFSESFALNGRVTISRFEDFTFAMRLLYYI